ncbi:MAG: hypothetical protein IJW55_10275 [Clostridia bacterium]|nr:hypothetical protein [Clostridia bacterium]MBQ7348334.1 hypothetical protein [Clostridia bacterium]
MMKWTKIIIYVVIVLALVGICGFIAYFTGGFTTDFASFYVTVDGEDVLSTGSNFQVRHDDPMNVEVKYVFASASDEASGYSVKIVPNIVKDKDFDFRLNGDVYSFQAEKDLTAGFIIEQEENSFTLTPKGDITAILSAVYPGYNVEDCSDKGYENMFTLIVTSYNGEASIRVNFTVTEDIEGVIIDKEVIEF